MVLVNDKRGAKGVKGRRLATLPDSGCVMLGLGDQISWSGKNDGFSRRSDIDASVMNPLMQMGAWGWRKKQAWNVPRAAEEIECHA